MSDFFVRLPLADPSLFGSSLSGGDHRRVIPPVGDVLGESRSLANLVNPKSARQAQPSSETRTFLYTNISVVLRKQVREPYPFQVTAGEIYVMQILKAACGFL